MTTSIDTFEKLHELCAGLVREYRLSEETLTENQLVDAIRQALQSGDFVRYLSQENKQSVVYIPFRRAEQLQAQYNELLFQVDDVTPGESRHESALRILREYRERRDSIPPTQEKPKHVINPYTGEVSVRALADMLSRGETTFPHNAGETKA